MGVEKKGFILHSALFVEIEKPSSRQAHMSMTEASHLTPHKTVWALLTNK